jgi:drug/metabolite transporter (DMT)-like permease
MSATPGSVTRLHGPALRLALVVGVLGVSTSGVLVRLADAPVLALSFWRCFGGALALLPFAWRGVGAAAGRRGALAASGVMLAAHFALYIGAVGLTTVASAVLLATMSPLFVGLGAAVLLRERTPRRAWAGIAIATAGAVVIGAADAGKTVLGPRALLGDAMAFGAAILVSGYILIGRVARQTLPVVVYGVWVYGTAAAVLLAACGLTGSAITGFSRGTWLAILGLVVGPQLLGHTVFNQLLSALPASTVAVVVLAEPVGAGVLAWLVLGELPPVLFALGAPLVLLGVGIATRVERGKSGGSEAVPRLRRSA